MNAPRYRNRTVLPIRGHEEREPELIDSTELTFSQVVDAVHQLHEDATKYPRFPWKDLAQLAGPMCPEDLILIAARTGGGKSLFLQNLFDALIVSGRCGLYVGLKQSPKTLRNKWACLRAGVDPRFLLATKPEERNTPAWHEAMDKVQAELKWRNAEIREAAHFSGVRRINASGLRSWTEWAVIFEHEFVIVDHIDRIQHGEGKNSFHEVSETVRLAKELAVENSLVMLVASQVGRPTDPVEAFMPPALHNLRGAGTKEEEADTVLGIYRPLKTGSTEKDIKRVRTGLANSDTIVEPNQMGVRMLKHRIDGSAMGKAVRLGVFHGRISDLLEERDRYGTSYEEARRI